MSRLFEERERAAEMRFVRSEEARFLAHCQGVKSLAAYAAELLGVDRLSSDAYADELMASVIQGARSQALVERVQADLRANGVSAEIGILAQQLCRPPGPGAQAPRPD
ncbi:MULTISPECIES: ATPase inhibitor subunit zeta [unclassified Methylobacterium]|uniref:ATPase inhibitor subunit zeta n=1 Tax=unclassified Methylobacterium TaxID=2615210 RepID=UPI0006F6D8F0|nr:MULTISPECIES: ATPase inhibitor subunit zeta [unclassified Methylobacterium]KQP94664.1 hypothetical protein ASF60_00100 [Methylobacterium sp. Leaf113]MCK2055570.1 DUF1476 family protein [Methylobacterium sp. 37f]